MKYKLTIETDNLDEVFLTVSTLRGKANVLMETIDGAEPAKEKKTRKVKDTAETTLVKDSEPVEKTTEANAYDAVKTATLALIKAKGKPVALDLLAEFEVKAATELKESDYDAYVNRANILLGKAA